MPRLHAIDTEAVFGTLHEPDRPSGEAMALIHGAGGNGRYPLLVRLAESFCADGAWVLRCDLPSTRRGHVGPTTAEIEAVDRESMLAALSLLRPRSNHLLLSGHSYGARQSTLLAARAPECCDVLMLMSYSLFHPDHPDVPRSTHFPGLRVPALFVHGDSDPYGGIDDIRQALALIPAPSGVVVITEAGHDLRRGEADLFPAIRKGLDALRAPRTSAM
jgi:predicted alpha/beta-hydrolase family hydrolase